MSLSTGEISSFPKEVDDVRAEIKEVDAAMDELRNRRAELAARMFRAKGGKFVRDELQEERVIQASVDRLLPSGLYTEDEIRAMRAAEIEASCGIQQRLAEKALMLGNTDEESVAHPSNI